MPRVFRPVPARHIHGPEGPWHLTPSHCHENNLPHHRQTLLRLVRQGRRTLHQISIKVRPRRVPLDSCRLKASGHARQDKSRGSRTLAESSVRTRRIQDCLRFIREYIHVRTVRKEMACCSGSSQRTRDHIDWRTLGTGHQHSQVVRLNLVTRPNDTPTRTRLNHRNGTTRPRMLNQSRRILPQVESVVRLGCSLVRSSFDVGLGGWTIHCRTQPPHHLPLPDIEESQRQQRGTNPVEPGEMLVQ